MFFRNSNDEEMKPTDLAKYLTDFISKYLPNERGASSNTISAYTQTFVLLLQFMEEQYKIKLEKLKISDIKRDTIVGFLNWLQKERNSSNATRNARLAAIHSFFKYLQYENLGNIYRCQEILSIRTKKANKSNVKYLMVEGIKLLLAQPDIGTRRGRRDLAILSLMYDTGARVQEIIDMTPAMFRFAKSSTVQIVGKGGKARIVPMIESQLYHLKNYIKELHLDRPEAGNHPLFFNSRKEKFTRAGLNHILEKYRKKAYEENSTLVPEKISCHVLRHSKAMHLLQAGVNLVYIRDILGHVSIKTTEIYARADSKQKRDALSAAYVNVQPKEDALWTENENLISWLKKF